MGAFPTLTKMYSCSVIRSISPGAMGLIICQVAIMLVPQKERFVIPQNNNCKDKVPVDKDRPRQITPSLWQLFRPRKLVW